MFNGVPPVKLFHPSQYAKVMPILLNSRENSRNSHLQIFPTTRPHITWETYFFIIFLTFSFIFFKLKRRSKGGVEFENVTFSTGSCHEPVLMPQTPLVPVGGSNWN